MLLAMNAGGGGLCRETPPNTGAKSKRIQPGRVGYPPPMPLAIVMLGVAAASQMNREPKVREPMHSCTRQGERRRNGHGTGGVLAKGVRLGGGRHTRRR